MASNIVQLVPLQMSNADKNVIFTVYVHPDVQERCVKDSQLATKMFFRMEEKYKVDSSGHRNLSVAESFELVSEFGLLDPVATDAKGNGISIRPSRSKPTEFDGVSAAAYTKDVSDDTVCHLGRLIPKGLTPQEKVRCLEHMVASVPNDHSQAKKARGNSSTSVSARNRTDTLVDDDMDMDTQDDNDSVFSMSTSSSFSSQSDQSQVRINWTEDQVRLLVELRRQFEHLFASSVITQKQAWKKVSEEMTEKGYCYSGDDCQRKFGSLRLRYKTIKDRNSKTGRGRTTWKFFNILEEMFAGDPAIEPLAEVSSMPLPQKKQPLPGREINDTVCDDTLMTDIVNTPAKNSNCVKTTPKTPTSKKSSWASTLSELSEMREQQRKHEERMEMEKKRLDIETKRLEALQKLVDAIVDSKK